MKSLLAYLAIVAAIFGGIYIKSWQCQELFPHANQVARLFWK